LNALGDFFLWGLTDVINDIVQPHQNGHKGTKGAPMPSSSKTKAITFFVSILHYNIQISSFLVDLTLLISGVLRSFLLPNFV
jgi:hypothetical protein